ncbi:alpha/beta hydrolase [Sunxiuqinia rutila]|uniref:alpha/beta hydrolase n=1 Tax=Sunxiuqinia rutila TaxID=1397841 RepID=UPI003D365859
MTIFFRILLAFLAILVLLYLIGPRPEKPILSSELKDLKVSINNLESFIQDRESKQPVKPDNQARIVWANDSMKSKTPYCLLYLHGFSASWYEGTPTHLNFAHHFQANAYLPRLASHGLDMPEPLQDMTPDRLYESAKEALQIAHLLGEKVIIMSTSTGGTLSLKLAAEFPGMVDALILLSPNIRINNPGAWLLAGPWGLQIGRKASGGKYRVVNDNPAHEECKHWNCSYRVEAMVYLQQLVKNTMHKKLFQRISQPVFLGYYYQDEEHQDEIVRVDAMLKMYEQLGTPSALKRKQAFNAQAHVIGCEAFSKAQPEVEQACIQFATEVLKMQAVSLPIAEE